MGNLFSVKSKSKQDLGEDFLTEFDALDGNCKVSSDEHKKRKARFDALEELRNRKSLREQIDYLYDSQFINLSSQAQTDAKKQKERS